MDRLIATLAQSDPPLQTILYLAALDAPPPEAGAPAEASAPTGQGALIGLLHLVQALVQHGATRAPRLWLVTRGAQPVTDADPIVLDQTPLWGLARTIALEVPQLQCSSIDLGAGPASAAAALLCREVLAAGPENQVAYRQGQRWR